jgi:hypothetical protein
MNSIEMCFEIEQDETAAENRDYKQLKICRWMNELQAELFSLLHVSPKTHWQKVRIEALEEDLNAARRMLHHTN